MLVAIVSFCAGAVTSFAVLRASVRRAVAAQLTEEMTERRWQAILGAAGYGPADRDVGRRAAARFEAELGRTSSPRRDRAATLTPADLEAIRPRQRSRLPFGIIIRSRG